MFLLVMLFNEMEVNRKLSRVFLVYQLNEKDPTVEQGLERLQEARGEAAAQTESGQRRHDGDQE